VNTSGVKAAANAQDGAYHQIEVYTEVMHHIQQDYVTDPNIPAVTHGALRGLLESLDADSSYLTADDYKIYKAAGSTPGNGGRVQVGINVSKRYGYATVVSVVPGSAADKAGLINGDILEAIDGRDTRDISLAMIRLMLEGAPGSTLTVGVISHDGKAEPVKTSMVRAAAAIPLVSVSLYENNSILYLKPGVLDSDHVDVVEAKLKGMQKAGNKKILLDLRDVATGEMPQAVRLTNLLLGSGTIATLQGQKFPKQTFTADAAKAVQPTAPLVVLVNRGTAGPAELVAAALLDNKRANLVGEKTFGEGAEQKTFELSDGSALILSVAKYASPSGKIMQDEAVTPDVLVSSGANAGDGDEEALPPSAAPIVKKPGVQLDEPLSKALDLLKAKA
jgi:carboxyl-terminal processing protease